MKKFIYKALAVAGLVSVSMLTACQADMDTQDMEVPKADIERNISIADLKALFADRTAMVGEREDGSHYIISGRVISNDASGNIYKSLVIQDETAALAFSINQSNLSVMYPVGQEVVVDVTGLYMGYYRLLQQCGWLSDPYDSTPQLGFMALDIFKSHAQLNGLPDPEVKVINYGDPRPEGKMYITVADIATLPAAGEGLRGMQSQLVEFRNVHFKGAGVQKFSIYQESGVNDTIVNEQGNTLLARTSGYCNFYDVTLPEGKGYVRGILSYYGTTSGSYQLMFRSLADVNITTKGGKDDPFSIDDILSGNYNGLSGWTHGYIVGSVKADVMTVTSNDDIIFGPDAELDNNLVIAASEDETDWTKCVCVELPNNSAFRIYANLADNREVYKKEISLDGNISTYMGMPAIIDNGGAFADFEIPGVSENGASATPAAKGDGTELNPYNLGAVLRSEAPASGVWVEGYVVGYVSGSNFASTAIFGNTDNGSSNFANNANIILSENQPIRANVGNSAPVQVKSAFKSVLGIKANPAIYGKKVRIKGDIVLDWLGSPAIRQISEVVVL